MFYLIFTNKWPIKILKRGWRGYVPDPAVAVTESAQDGTNGLAGYRTTKTT